MSFGKYSFNTTPVYIKAQPTAVAPTTGAEYLATTTVNPEDISQTIENSSESLLLDPVEDFKLESPQSLKNEIAQYKELHLRPMSQSEYSRLVKTLKDQVSETGAALYRYQVGAIARVIKENFEKWFPSVELDYQVNASLEHLYEIDHILKTQYHETLEKYRDAFTSSTAEEVAALYTDEEKKRLRGLGMAFLGDKWKYLDLPLLKDTKKEVSAPFKFNAPEYQHPMLKQGLLKSKGLQGLGDFYSMPVGEFSAPMTLEEVRKIQELSEPAFTTADMVGDKPRSQVVEAQRQAEIQTILDIAQKRVEQGISTKNLRYQHPMLKQGLLKGK